MRCGTQDCVSVLPPLPPPPAREAAVSISGAPAVMGAARIVPVEHRSVFLERTAPMLRLRRPFTDDDVADVVRLASCGLVQTPTAAA